ncbi:MAG: DUF4265 domain-containing protein, partial [Actinobacteria bacterium]|nr:DUF4265 domain-containing protein [Actinomycetota bacterium]
MNDVVARLAQIQFVDPDGRLEVLWAERLGDGSYIVLNVPVHVYGLSLGTRVQCTGLTERFLKFERIVLASP